MRPPVIARAFVRLFARAEDRSFLLGDLDDRFRELARTQGFPAAKRWYWRQALSAAPWSVVPHGVRLHPASWAPLSGVREAARGLVRTPLFTVVSILSVGVGIGLATSVFAVAHQIFFTPLPYPHADRLVEIWQTQRPGSHQRSDYLAPQRMLGWVKTPMRYMAGVSGYGLGPDMVLEGDGAPTRVSVHGLVGDWFGTLGTPPALGRVLTPEDYQPGVAGAAVVSWAFWRVRMSGDQSALGKVLHLSGMAVTVVGVMPKAFDADQVVWVPEEILPTKQASLAYLGVARLKPGATQLEARQEIEQRSAAQVAADSARWAGLAATTTPMDQMERGGDRPTLWILAGVVAAVLLIGLSNLTTLFLVRAQERSASLAVRASLGASTWQLGRGLLSEALLVGAGGSAIGVLLSVWGKGAVASLISGSGSHAPSLGPASVVAAALLGLLVTGIIGLEPLRRLRLVDVRDLLQRRAAGSTSTRSERRSRDVMVGTQVAVCVVLLALLGIFGSAYRGYASADVGYDPRGLIQAVPDYELAKMEAPEQWAVVRQVDERLRHDPAIRGIAAWRMIVEHYPPRPQSDAVMDGPPRSLSVLQRLWSCYEVDPGFFTAVGLHLLRGRTFTDADDANAPPVAIVSRSGAEAWWPGESPIGHRVKLGRDGEWMTVVGEIENSGHIEATLVRDVRSVRKNVYMPLLFRPARQVSHVPPGWTAENMAGALGAEIAVRAAGDPALAERHLRSAFTAVAPDVPLRQIGDLYDLQMHSYGAETLIVTPGRMVGAGAIVGLLLAVVGIVGVVADSVSRRTREIGVRVALGARARHVLSTVAHESLVTALVGLAIGLAALTLLRSVITKVFFNYEVRALAPGVSDPRVLAAAGAVLLLLVLGASLLTARHALHVDPAEALRSE